MIATGNRMIDLQLCVPDTTARREAQGRETQKLTSRFLGRRPHRNSGHHTSPRKLIKEENRLTFSGPMIHSQNARLEVSLAFSTLGRQSRSSRIWFFDSTKYAASYSIVRAVSTSAKQLKT